MFYGDRADPARVLEATASGLREGVDLAEVPGRVCQVVVESLRLGSAALVLGGDSAETPLAVAGTPAGPATELPMRHRGEVVGRLRVAPRPGERGLDQRDAEILDRVADQAAPALAALQLHRGSSAAGSPSYDRREVERRRLRRELHDGLGATLAGMRLQVESARRLVGEPTAGDSSARVRRRPGRRGRAPLCEDLRPPGVDELGWAGALHVPGHRGLTGQR